MKPNPEFGRSETTKAQSWLTGDRWIAPKAEKAGPNEVVKYEGEIIVTISIPHTSNTTFMRIYRKREKTETNHGELHPCC